MQHCVDSSDWRGVNLPSSNVMDPYAVLVIKDSIVIEHLPRKISAECSIFIDLGRRINCCVTGSRRYSQDLPQGGLEIEIVNSEYRAKFCFEEAPNM